MVSRTGPTAVGDDEDVSETGDVTDAEEDIFSVVVEVEINVVVGKVVVVEVVLIGVVVDGVVVDVVVVVEVVVDSMAASVVVVTNTSV